MSRKRKIGVVLGVILIIAMGCGGYYLYSHYYPRLRRLFIDEDKTVVVRSEYRFGDVNSKHLKVARKNGIKPVERRGQLPTKRLVRIVSCDEYMVEQLTHSVPYLTPASAKLLEEIGARFQAELKKQGLEKHRIIVTSVLRTEDDVKRLQKVNANASANSAHQYATTFDITYIRFDWQSAVGNSVGNGRLSNILGAVLKQLRDEGRCYIKYEQNQHCFHITSKS